MHAELLRLAKLLSEEAGGLPRWVAQNRAVSTAYYALFHALAEHCARELVGAWKPWQPFRHIYRSLDHGQARKVFEELARDREADDALRRVSRIFVDLQKARHSADYDPGYRVSRVEMADVIARARLGIEILASIPPVGRSLLAARLIGRARG